MRERASEQARNLVLAEAQLLGYFTGGTTTFSIQPTRKSDPKLDFAICRAGPFPIFVKNFACQRPTLFCIVE